MAKFPIDAAKSKVIKTLEKLGFKIVREREHIAMIRENERNIRKIKIGWLEE